ncbi:MAG: winged helix-turn-helix domain-containing protein [Thermoproteus sp.]
MSGEEDFLPDFYVLARILALVRNGVRKRRSLALMSGLNYRSFQRYLDYLVERGLVRDGAEITLTPKGAEILDRLEDLIKEISSRENPFDTKRR